MIWYNELPAAERQVKKLLSKSVAFLHVFCSSCGYFSRYLIDAPFHHSKCIGVFQKQERLKHNGAALHVCIRDACFAVVAYPPLAPALLVVLRAFFKVS